MGSVVLANKRNGAFFFFGYLIFIGAIAWYCYLKPSYNWDTLPYMALILRFEEDDINSIHQRVFEISEEEIPPVMYQRMTDTTHLLRRGAMEDPNTFFQFVSFFQIKPLYVWSSYLFYKAGFSLTRAPVIPSLFSYLAVSILVFFWLAKFYQPLLTAILSVSIMVAPPILDGARLATPDMLSTFIVLIAFYLFLNEAEWKWIALVMTVAILIRLDNIILAVVWLLIQVAIVKRKSGDVKLFPLYAIILIGWILYAAFLIWYVDFQNGFENFYGGLTNRIYPWTLVEGVISGLKTLQSSHLTVVVAICTMVLFYGKKRLFVDNSLRQYLFMILIIYLMLKYMFFPDLTTRLHLPVFITSILLIFEELRIRARTGGATSSN